MSKKIELFASNHTAQIKWLNGQIAKNNGSIFCNPKLAEKAWEAINVKNIGILDDQDVEEFVSRYLSEKGNKKLYTTLRVAETRAKKNGFRLQCNIEYSANQKLEKIIRKTRQSKGDFISLLLDQVDFVDGMLCFNSVSIENKSKDQEGN